MMLVVGEGEDCAAKNIELVVSDCNCGQGVVASAPCLINCHSSVLTVQQPSGEICTYLRATLSVIEVIICYCFTSGPTGCRPDRSEIAPS